MALILVEIVIKSLEVGKNFSRREIVRTLQVLTFGFPLDSKMFLKVPTSSKKLCG